MKTLCFVTPAYRRYELTRICLEQRAHVCEVLREHYGVDATCVVIADDDNLDIARTFGFLTVERDNRWLGRRFNDGYEAAAKAGFDYVFAIGSDSWVDPDYFAELPDDNTVLMSRYFSCVRADGRERMDCEVVYPSSRNGVAAIVPTQLYRTARYRPCEEELSKGCDSSTWRRLPARARRVFADAERTHDFEYMGFQSAVQVTEYRHLRKWANHVERRPERVLGELEDVYPVALVEKIRDFYARQLPPNLARRQPLARRSQ